MSTNNAVNTNLSGQTGTGSFVGSIAPTFTQIAFSPTTGGIIGTAAADNAGAGKVGEVITSNIPNASAISVSNNTPFDLTSISLTAGDWDVFGNVSYIASIGLSALNAWLSLTSATVPGADLRSLLNGITATFGGLTAPILRVNVSGNTTVYISGQVSFVSGTCTASGTIFARRRR